VEQRPYDVDPPQPTPDASASRSDEESREQPALFRDPEAFPAADSAAGTVMEAAGGPGEATGAPGEAAPGGGVALDDESSQPRPRTVGPFSVPRVIALANQKGGVGKTTTALTLAACLADAGRRVVVVDFDPQGGCAIGLGVNPNALDLTVYNLVLQDDVGVQDVLVKSRIDGLELIPSNIDLAAAELILVQEVAREQVLKRALEPLKREYDFVLIDCPPSLGLLTINALTAADTVIVPLECEYFALRGVGMLMDTVRKVQTLLNPHLKVEGILATMYDARTLHTREVLERLRDAFGDLVFSTVIPKTIRFAEAPVAGEPITSYAPTSPGADGYRRLSQEVLGT
jgi:chromosome partitioning protein